MTPQREEAERLLRLASRDHAAFLVLIAAPGVPSSVALFHAQQAAEKALKSVMCVQGLTFRRTHDLEQLANQLAAAEQITPVSETDLSKLTPYAVEHRYDDDAPDMLSGAQAGAMVDAILAWAALQLAQLK